MGCPHIRDVVAPKARSFLRADGREEEVGAAAIVVDVPPSWVERRASLVRSEIAENKYNTSNFRITTKLGAQPIEKNRELIRELIRRK